MLCGESLVVPRARFTICFLKVIYVLGTLWVCLIGVEPFCGTSIAESVIGSVSYYVSLTSFDTFCET